MADITITRETAQQLYELYNSVVAADSIYRSCQSPLFRQHVSAVANNTGVQGAFDALKAQLDAPPVNPVPTQRSRKGVLNVD